MKFNLTWIVRCIVIALLSLMGINVLVLLRTPPQINISSLYGGILRSVRVNSNDYGLHLKLKSNGTCPGLEMKQPHEDGEFQIVNDMLMFVYSAYQDGGRVRVIALHQAYSHLNTLMCQMWFQVKDRDPLYITPASVVNMPEDHGKRFTASFVFCQVPAHLVNVTVHAVSLVNGKQCNVPKNILRMHQPGILTSQFTVCVTPLNYRYSRAYELVEMIELNKLLGATRFVFYNHSTGPNVDKVLQLYAGWGLVEVHPWHLPMKTDTWPPRGEPDIHYFAQMAALNDCLYRHKQRAKFLVYQDLDEFIIPYKHNTWAELISDSEVGEEAASSWLFKNIFFRKEWPSPILRYKTAIEKYKSIILTYTMREMNYLPYSIRSKYIINPRQTSIVGIHTVYESFGNYVNVPEHLASLHHYRNWELPHDSQPRVEDTRTATKYGKRLVKRLEEVWSKLEGVALDINISTYGDHV